MYHLHLQGGNKIKYKAASTVCLVFYFALKMVARRYPPKPVKFCQTTGNVPGGSAFMDTAMKTSHVTKDVFFIIMTFIPCKKNTA
jgi:hypothetical protein